TATAPAGRGRVDIHATTPAGTSADRPAAHFSYLDGPGIYSVTPDDGPTTGKTKVTITGFGLAPHPVVYFGRQRATVVSATDQKLVVTAPPGCGVVNIRVVVGHDVSRIVPADRY